MYEYFNKPLHIFDTAKFRLKTMQSDLPAHSPNRSSQFAHTLA